MYLVFRQLSRRLVAIGIIGLLLGFNAPSIAQTFDNPLGKGLVDLSISDEKGNELQFNANQIPLTQVLDAIAKKVHIPIHYSDLPEGLVSTACPRSLLKPLLECLLDRKADLIVRYPRSRNNGSKVQIAEAWVVGATKNVAAANSEIPTVTNAPNTRPNTLQQNQPDNEKIADGTDEPLTKAQSDKPDERATAIAALLAGGQKDDPDVKATLERALIDKDAEVRAQAISSLSHREGSEADGAIQQAMLDDSADVRLMAVEGITDDVTLLQQAINDNDESVRSLAEIKLQLLTQDQNNPPD